MLDGWIPVIYSSRVAVTMGKVKGQFAVQMQHGCSCFCQSMTSWPAAVECYSSTDDLCKLPQCDCHGMRGQTQKFSCHDFSDWSHRQWQPDFQSGQRSPNIQHEAGDYNRQKPALGSYSDFTEQAACYIQLLMCCMHVPPEAMLPKGRRTPTWDIALHTRLTLSCLPQTQIIAWQRSRLKVAKSMPMLRH